jgi:hypothetical protein
MGLPPRGYDRQTAEDEEMPCKLRVWKTDLKFFIFVGKINVI